MEKEVWREELRLSFPSAHRVSRNRYIRLRHFHSIRNAITGFDSLICEGTKMTKCNRKKQLLGKSIRNVRMRRNMTQRELANAIEGIGESALRSYELGERSPKQDALERIAKALDVAPACFDTYGIERYDELVHALFLLEDRFGIEPCADGSIRFTDEAIQSCVCTWRDWKEFLEEGKITREEYEDRKDGLVG